MTILGPNIKQSLDGIKSATTSNKPYSLQIDQIGIERV